MSPTVPIICAPGRPTAFLSKSVSGFLEHGGFSTASPSTSGNRDGGTPDQLGTLRPPLPIRHRLRYTDCPQKNLSQKRSGTVLTTHWKLRENAPAMTTKVMMPMSVAAIVQNAVAIFSKAPSARWMSW